MVKDKVLSLLGLAQRAGKIRSGNFAAEESVKGGKSKLLLLAGDTSEASKKGYYDMCAYYGVKVAEYGDKEALGRALGKEYRSVISVEDDGFAKKLVMLTDGGRSVHGENQ